MPVGRWLSFMVSVCGGVAGFSYLPRLVWTWRGLLGAAPSERDQLLSIIYSRRKVKKGHRAEGFF